MKKTGLSVLLKVLLIAALVLCLAACREKIDAPASTPGAEGPVTYVSKYDSGDGWPELNQPLSWEAINAFPIKSEDMSLEDARQLCVDFFRFAKTATWISNAEYTGYHDWHQTRSFTLQPSGIYGGLPYVSLGSGSIYRLMDFMDEETGVVNVTEAGKDQHFLGNQCCFGAYWGWGRVINSPDYGFTENMFDETGFLKIGGYEYGTQYLMGWSEGYGTDEVVAFNGPEKMYACYALLDTADGIINWTTAGHVVMIAEKAHVEYTDEAKTVIDPEKSYVIVVDQGQSWAEGTNEGGDKYQYQNRVNAKITFKTLYDNAYMPFTYAEWTGDDPIEKTETTFSHTGETITTADIFKGTVKSNYGISDIYAYIYDAKGNEVCKIANHVEEAGMKELRFFKQGGGVYIWGDYSKLNAADGYTVKIVTQLATGERPTLWEGKLA